jgi:hypothetical protein
VSADLIEVINECNNLEKLTFIDIDFAEPFHDIPPITQLRNLTMLEVHHCLSYVEKQIILTLFHDMLFHLADIGIPSTHGDIHALLNTITLKCPLLTHLYLEGNLHTSATEANIYEIKLSSFEDTFSGPGGK